MALNDERIVTLNCGLGRDSIAMICLCVEGALWSEDYGVIRPEDLDCVVFSNTGNEWPGTYKHILDVGRICRDHDIRFLVLEKGIAANDNDVETWEDVEWRAEYGAYHYRPALMDDFQSRATVASLGKGDCTDNHKIQPIRRMMNDISTVRWGLNNRQWSYRVKSGEREPHINIVGIAADETTRIPDEEMGPLYCTEAYPLAEMGLDKADETPILERWNLNSVRKSGCYMCPYQPAGWYWALRETHPGLYADAVEYERVALERNPRMAATGFKHKGEPMTIPEVVERWRSRNPDAGIDEVLDKSYSRCTKEVRKEQKKEFS